MAPHCIFGGGRESPGLVNRKTICGAGCFAGGSADEVNGVFRARRERCLADDVGDVGAQVLQVLVGAVADHQANVQWGALPFRRHDECSHFQDGAGFGGDADRVAGLGAHVRLRHLKFLVERIGRLGVMRHRHAGLLVVREHAHVVASVLLLLDIASIDVGRAAVVARRDADVRQPLHHHRVAVKHGAQQSLHRSLLDALEGDDFGGVGARVSGRNHAITRLRAGEARTACDFVVRIGATLVGLDVGSVVLGCDVDVGVLAHWAEALDRTEGVELVERDILYAANRIRGRRSGLQFCRLQGTNRGGRGCRG